LADSGVVTSLDSDGWPEIDTSVAHIARMYDYLLGGKANFAVDREAADFVTSMLPGGADAVRANVRANRELLGRVVRYLAADAGIRQFLDIGTGVPRQDNTHEVAQRAAPGSRIVYVDNDPIVLAHAHQLLTSTPEGATAYIFGDLRDPDAILSKAAETLDLSQPVALITFGLLHFFPDDDHPQAILASLMAALAPGSYLAVSHLASDVPVDELEKSFRELNARMNGNMLARSRGEVAAFFDGLAIDEPGVALAGDWRPGPAAAASPGVSAPIWCAVGRKPTDP
jgi:trans-aconitate methyltransferase